VFDKNKSVRLQEKKKEDLYMEEAWLNFRDQRINSTGTVLRHIIMHLESW